MNIALSTVVLFILLIPGLLYRRFYYSEEFSKEYFKETFFGTFFSAFLPSLLLHTVWYYLTLWIGPEVDINAVISILGNDVDSGVYASISENVTNIVRYNITISLAAVLAGYISKQIVRYFKLDRSFKLFRFQNSWHYILKGEFFDFPRATFELQNDEVEDIEFVYVDAIVDSEVGTILYEGIFVDYELSNNGGLNFITLKNTTRKILGKKEEDMSNEIKGHVVVLPYNHIKNLNLTYYRIIEEESGDLTIKQVD